MKSRDPLAAFLSVLITHSVTIGAVKITERPSRMDRVEQWAYTVTILGFMLFIAIF